MAGMACLVGVDFGAKLLASLAKIFQVQLNCLDLGSNYSNQ